MEKSTRLKLPIINQFVATIKVANEIPDDPNELAGIVNQLAKALKLQVVKSFYHRFSPSGVTYVAILAQSHLVIHTWPEYKTFHIDLVSCSDIVEDQVKEVLVDLFSEYSTEEINVVKV